MNWLRKHIPDGAGAFIIAEAGINHNGCFDLALELIRQAKAAGADCVKFQTFRTDACESSRSTAPSYFEGRDGKMSKLDWSRSLEFSAEQFRELKKRCEETDIAFLSTACDLQGLDILLGIGAPALKFSSGDLTNLTLLRKAAASGLPAILSTGMASMDNVAAAVAPFRASGSDFALLQCTSQYPAPYGQINLRAMKTLADAFHCPVGLSDHSRGVHIPVAAAVLGAAIIEKHFTLSRRLPGVDHAASLEPDEFKSMVEQVRQAEAALGRGVKEIQDCERGNIASMRKSILAARPIAKGAIIGEADLAVKRPGDGLAPDKWDLVVGRRAAADIETDQCITLELLDDA